jgi:copper transport protein
MAAAAVAIIAVSGFAQSWRQVGSLDALGSTTYGRLLVVKVVLVAAMVAVAAASRRQVAGQPAAPIPVGAAGRPGAPPTRRTLRRTVLTEAAIGVAVLAVTALLVNTPPARSQTAQPFAALLVQGDRLLDVSLSPAARGTNELHLVLSSTSGSLLRAEDATVRLTLPERDLGPLPVRVDSAGPDHWVALGLDIPFAGTWRLEVLVSVGGAQVRFAVDVPVR